MPPTKLPRAAQNKAIVPASITADDLHALLGAAGAFSQGGGEYHRLVLAAGILIADKGTPEEEKWYPRKDGPAITLRIVEPPAYYSGVFLSETGRDGAFNPARIGRPDLNNRYCRRWDDQSHQNDDNNPANDVFDEVKAALATEGKYPRFMADMKVQIVPDDGQLTGDETVYTLTLSTTSIFEWRGSSKNKYGGTVSEKNTMVLLGELAIQNAIEAGADEAGQKRAVLDALTALSMGAVICDVYINQASNSDKTNEWSILSFVPVYIGDVNETAALEAGDDLTANSDDVPV